MERGRLPVAVAAGVAGGFGAVGGVGGAARAETFLVSPETSPVNSAESLTDWSLLESGPFFGDNRRSRLFSKPDSPGRSSRNGSTKLDGTSHWIVSLIRAAGGRFVAPVSAAQRRRLPAGPVPLKPNPWTEPIVVHQTHGPAGARDAAPRVRTLTAPYPEGRTPLVREACPD